MSKIAEASRRALEVRTVKLDDIVKNFGGVVTINGLSYTSYKGNPVPVFSFVEGEGAVFRGTCKKLVELADALKELYAGNLQAINEDFKRTGIRVKIEEQIPTSTGNRFRPVSRLGEVDFDDFDDEETACDDEPACDEETGEVIAPSQTEKDPF